MRYEVAPFSVLLELARPLQEVEFLLLCVKLQLNDFARVHAVLSHVAARQPGISNAVLVINQV